VWGKRREEIRGSLVFSKRTTFLQFAVRNSPQIFQFLVCWQKNIQMINSLKKLGDNKNKLLSAEHHYSTNLNSEHPERDFET
jgi:hypothetical protein